MLRAARAELRAGLEARRVWSERVRMKPKSRGGEEEGTMRRVYSTPMKKRRESPNAKGMGWCLIMPTTSSTDLQLPSTAKEGASAAPFPNLPWALIASDGGRNVILLARAADDSWGSALEGYWG